MLVPHLPPAHPGFGPPSYGESLSCPCSWLPCHLLNYVFSPSATPSPPTPAGRHPSLVRRTPRADGYCCGRYAFYCNAFFFFLFFAENGAEVQAESSETFIISYARLFDVLHRCRCRRSKTVSGGEELRQYIVYHGTKCSIAFVTRRHPSRMRTVRCSGRILGACV